MELVSGEAQCVLITLIHMMASTAFTGSSSYLCQFSSLGYWQRQRRTLTLHYGEQWHQQVAGLPGYLERGAGTQLNTRRRKNNSPITVIFFSQPADTLRNRPTATSSSTCGESTKTTDAGPMFGVHTLYSRLPLNQVPHATTCCYGTFEENVKY